MLITRFVAGSLSMLRGVWSLTDFAAWLVDACLILIFFPLWVQRLGFHSTGYRLLYRSTLFFMIAFSIVSFVDRSETQVVRRSGLIVNDFCLIFDFLRNTTVCRLADLGS